MPLSHTTLTDVCKGPEFAGCTDFRWLTLNLKLLFFWRPLPFGLCHGPYTCCPSYPAQASVWEIVVIQWGFHWEELWTLWCDVALNLAQTSSQNPLLAGNDNFSLLSPLQKLNWGENSHIITEVKGKIGPFILYNIRTHRCISQTLLLKINSNNNNNNNVSVNWSHSAETRIVFTAVNCV